MHNANFKENFWVKCLYGDFSNAEFLKTKDVKKMVKDKNKWTFSMRRHEFSPLCFCQERFEIGE